MTASRTASWLNPSLVAATIEDMRTDADSPEKLISRHDAIAALERIAHILERESEPTYRVRAFRNAAAVVRGLPDAELEQRIRRGTLRSLAGIGPVTAAVIEESAGGCDTCVPATARNNGPGHCRRRAGAAPVTAR
jgi:hypothetical protein